MPLGNQPLLPGGSTLNIERVLNRPAIELLAEAQAQEESGNAIPLYRAAGAGEEVSILGVRELEEGEIADLPLTAKAGSGDVPTTTIQKMRARHHEIARLMAAGLSNKEIHQTLGVAVGTVGLLKRNPAFQNLLAYYMANRDAQAMDLAGQIKQTAALALDGLQQKAEAHIEGEEKLSTRELLEIAELTLDRSGHGPQHKVDTRNVNVTEEFLKALKESANARSSNIYSAEELSQHSDRGTGNGGEAALGAPELGQDSAGARGQDEGPRLREGPREEPDKEVQLSLL